MQAQINNKSVIAKVVGVLFAAFPSAEASEATIKLYVRMLSDIPLEVLEVSVQQCIAESEFLPTIAKLRDKAFAIQSNIAQMPTAFEAWAIVAKEFERTGFYHEPKFENPIIAKAVQCIGWRDLCCSENQVADRAHFARVYESLMKRAIEDARLLPATRELRERLIPQQLIAAKTV